MTLVVQVVTTALAFLGAVLGIINTRHAISQSRPNLRVRFLNNYAPPNFDLVGYSVEVTNLGTFALTVREVGLSMSPRWKRDLERMLLNEAIAGPIRPPVRLEPRQQVDFYIPSNFSGKTDKAITAAYVKTECGCYFTGVTPALETLAKKLRPI